MRAAGMRTLDEAHTPRLVRRLSRIRYPHGYDAELCGCDGRRASSRRGKRDVSTTTNARSLGSHGDHDAGAPDHFKIKWTSSKRRKR